VAKRVRGSHSTHRPGGQGPSRTKKTSDDPLDGEDDVLPATSVDDSDAEDLGAAYTEVEVDEVAAAAVAATAAPAAVAETTKPRRAKRRAKRRQNKARPDDLTARSAAENVWVRADLRRIGIVSVILIASLAVAWLIFGVLDVLNLY
jgi:hypothetical protein